MSLPCLPFTLAVGVTGHRTLPGTRLAAVEAQVARILDITRNTALNIARQGRNEGLLTAASELRLVSCMADGADRLVARQGLALGYRLCAVLPFPADSPLHERDKHGASRTAALAELHGLLRQAHDVLEWDAEGDCASDTPDAALLRQSAYAEAGLRMLDQSDLLIAVWHGQVQTRLGSTWDMVNRALDKGLPVIWIHATEERAPMLCTKGELGHARTSSLAEWASAGEKDAVSLKTVLLEHFQTPAMRTNTGRTKKDECFARGLCLCRKEASPETPLFRPFWLPLWQKFYKRIAPPPAPTDKAKGCPPSDEWYGYFSGLARHYANLYRSFFLLASILASMAVSVAALAAVLPAYGWFVAVKIGLGVAEVAILGSILKNYHRAQRGEWQRKLTEYRLAAEWLRHQQYLRMVGRATVKAVMTPYYSVGCAPWLRWQLRLIIRAAGVPGIRLDKNALASVRHTLDTCWLAEQEAYHSANARRCSQANHRLHTFTNIMFFATVICVGLHAVLEMTSDLHVLGNLLTFISIICPVWGMSAHALSHYGELCRLHDRSTCMSKKLAELRTGLKAAQTFADVGAVAMMAADLMLQESMEWEVQYKMPVVPLG